jgi:Skp family chaperone for outer membrane proteins
MILGIFWMLVDAASYLLGVNIGNRNDAQIKRDAKDTFADSKEGQQIEKLRRELEDMEQKLKKDRTRGGTDREENPNK